MSRTVTDNFRRAVYAQETHEAFICLLTITHPSFEQDVRLCNDPFENLPDAGTRGVVSRGDEFVFLPFEFELPAQNDGSAAKASLAIDNIDREIVAAVRNADSAITVKIELVLSSDPDTVEFLAENFKLERITYDAMTVSGELSLEYYELEPFPTGRFTPTQFPGLF